MSEGWILFKVSLVVLILFIFSTFLIVSENFRSKIKICLCTCLYYSGVCYAFRKFIPTKKEFLPTGVIWLIGIYFAAYAFTVQRYENRLDKVETKYIIFTTQVAAGAKFSNQRLMKILNTNLPIKPYVSISKFLSIYHSFRDDSYHESFFHSYGYSSASEFRTDIINQWKNKLEKADFSEAKFEIADFKGASLKRANFRDAILVEADFSNSNLESADFNGANLINADFHNASLNEAIFNDAKLTETIFRDAVLEGGHLITKDAEKADFNGAILVDADFRHAMLNMANFGGTNLKDAHFNHANLRGALFGGANLEGAIFENADLEGADFRKENNYELNGYFIKSLEKERSEFDQQPITAKQLIMAKSIYGIKRVPPKVIENLKKYGCEKMLTERPDEWTKEFKRYRAEIIWKFNPLWSGDSGGVTNAVRRIHSK